MLAADDSRADAPQRNLAYDSFEISTLTPHIGAKIRGLDLSKPLSEPQEKDLRRALSDWLLLVFRDQHLTREQHKELGRRFGRLHVHPMHKGGHRGTDPEILPVKTTAKSPYTAGDGWHTDVTCDEIPPLGSMLYITETPECGGGDTLFADMYLAYELLSDPMKRFLDGLTAIHDGALPYVGGYKTTPPEGGYPRSEHPVVTRHPETGRKVLYVNGGFTSHIVGLSRAESRAILDMLYRHIDSTPKLYCRVEWEPNTLTFWDNRCTQHHAVWDYYPHSRYGERVSILGDQRPSA
jgi:taurine dioxygenase